MSDPAPSSKPVVDPRLDPRLDPPPPRSRRLAGTATRRFWELELWKKLLLVLAILLAVVGIVGAVTGTVRGKPPEVVAAQTKVEDLHTTAARSSLTGEQQTELREAESRVETARHWFYDKTAPQLWRIGLGFFIAFVLGFMARQFLGTMAILAAIVLVGVGVALYFGALDSGGVKANVTTGTGWLMDRLDSMKETLLKFVSASLSGTAGFVIGFLRKR
jgi:uncharacterized membrane protein (Fun14 family)